MSGDNSYSASLRETPAAAGSDHAATQARSAGTGLAEAPPAEPMSRAEYAGYMRQSSAAGEGAPGFVGAGDYSNPDGDPATNQPGSGTDAGQLQPTGRAMADLGPAEQPAESLTPQAAVAENGADIHHGRIAIADLDEDGGNPAESPTRQEATDNRGHDSASTAGGQPDLTGTDLASAGPELEPQAQSSADRSAGADPGQPERTEMPAGDVVKPLSPEAEQLKVLEVENAQARQMSRAFSVAACGFS
jgi:hypothetical protein